MVRTYVLKYVAFPRILGGMSGVLNFILRWDHAKPLLELLLDGRVVIAEASYWEAWPTRFMTDVSLGAWPRHAPEHYVETCIAGWSTIDSAFDQAVVKAAVDGAAGLPPCAQN